MASAVNKLYHDSLPRGSMARAAAGLSNAEALLALNNAKAAAGGARATTATQAKTVNVVPFTIGGAFFSKGATDNFWTLSGAVVPAGAFQKYLLLVDASGVASVQEGTASTISAAAVTWTNVSGSAGASEHGYGALISVLNAGKAIFTVLTIATDATHPFTPGTTALNATGITATFADGIDASLLPVVANEQSLIVGAY